ncbi:MAG: lipoate--protein ligase [Allosphingosinicella sp.]
MTIRVLDFGCVSPISSQAIYHGLADALGVDDAPVITLCSPSDPYICVGALQDARLEVDEAYCRSRGLPILRREIGGGAVYLDRHQLFYHFVFPRDRAPAAALDLFPWFIEPVLRTYRGLGITARYRPVNDIHVDGRKIGGTAAAWIGEATVMGGSFMFDFDAATMARCLKVPSEKFRDKLATTLEGYMTTMAKLLPVVPPRATVKRRYLTEVAEWLGEELRESDPTAAEQAAIAAREKSMADPAFVYQFGRRMVAAGVKVAAGTHLTQGAWKAPGGLIRVVLLERAGIIADLDISGDFTCLPTSGVNDLATRLRGAPVDEASLVTIIDAVIADLDLDLPGVAPADLAHAIVASRHVLA